jgi:hypothetical protein
MSHFRPTRLQIIITTLFVVLALGLTFRPYPSKNCRRKCRKRQCPARPWFEI